MIFELLVLVGRLLLDLAILILVVRAAFYRCRFVDVAFLQLD